MSDETVNPAHSDPDPCSATTYIHAAEEGPGMFSVHTLGEDAEDADPVLDIYARPNGGRSNRRVAVIFLSWSQVLELRTLLQDAYWNAPREARGSYE